MKYEPKPDPVEEWRTKARDGLMPKDWRPTWNRPPTPLIGPTTSVRNKPEE